VIVIDALVSALRGRGLPVVEQPQAAANTNAHIDLWLTGLTAGGEKRSGGGSPLDYETMTFTAEITASGAARVFVGGLRKTLRIMALLGESSLPVPVTVPDPDQEGKTLTKTLRAHFERTGPGAFEYEAEGAPMPARFREPWRITITYPAGIVPHEED
jgi:hypothetical protein